MFPECGSAGVSVIRELDAWNDDRDLVVGRLSRGKANSANYTPDSCCVFRCGFELVLNKALHVARESVINSMAALSRKAAHQTS